MSAIGPLELMIMSGPYDGQVIRASIPNNRNPERGDGYILGRHPSCDISIPYDRWVSSRHARIYRDEEGWGIEDLNSTNRTHLALIRPDGTMAGKEQLVGSRPLVADQLVQLGRLWIRVHLG